MCIRRRTFWYCKCCELQLLLWSWWNFEHWGTTEWENLKLKLQMLRVLLKPTDGHTLASAMSRCLKSWKVEGQGRALCIVYCKCNSIHYNSIHPHIFFLLSKVGCGNCGSNYGAPGLLPEVSQGQLGNAIPSVNPGPSSRRTFPERLNGVASWMSKQPECQWAAALVTCTQCRAVKQPL